MYCTTPYYMIALIFLSLGHISSISAQENRIQKCGYDQIMSQLEHQYPGYKDNYLKAFDNAQRTEFSQQRGDILSIPLVIHVLYQNEEQNLSTFRINKVVESINKDFRHQNDNADNLRNGFKNIVSDPMIQFDLVEIKRISTTTSFSFNITSTKFPDHIKHTSQGGSDAVNTKEHLNIWICNIVGNVGLLGYSYPPSCAPNWPAGVAAPSPDLDGVVMHYKVFNTNSSIIFQGQVITVSGRTATHEIGHYLGLRHIWGDGPLTVLGQKDCSADDGILDTPNQGLPSQFICNPLQNTCIDASNDKPDLIENFMDYSDENCMSMFTKGQTKIMRNMLTQCRSGLISQVGVHTTDYSDHITIVPNPSNGISYIKIPSEIINNIVSLRLYDSYGKQLYNTTYTDGHNVKIDLSTHPSGMYIVQLTIDNKTISKKIYKL